MMSSRNVRHRPSMVENATLEKYRARLKKCREVLERDKKDIIEDNTLGAASKSASNVKASATKRRKDILSGAGSVAGVKYAHDHGREEFVSILFAMRADFLEAKKEMPMHEAIVCTDMTVLDAFWPLHTKQMKEDMLNPHHHLPCTCCGPPNSSNSKHKRGGSSRNKDNSTLYISSSLDLSSTMEDITIVYKLYVASGRFVNLYDWYMSFKEVYHPSASAPATSSSSTSTTAAIDEPATSSSTKLSEDDEDELQARFALAVDTLYMQGFFTRTERKSDHVVKLIPDQELADFSKLNINN
eukprot:TRINITY_DN12532_c0_g1_i2.p1 TRINITY_DN12532_c0_g1~~TRINITY_DN12532_c0_g1_i2.p1  ORF type:complete len:299 (-),score=79.53 TRINITY_DN12532_c0_g1_i2:370-1266(-)